MSIEDCFSTSKLCELVRAKPLLPTILLVLWSYLKEPSHPFGQKDEFKVEILSCLLYSNYCHEVDWEREKYSPKE